MIITQFGEPVGQPQPLPASTSRCRSSRRCTASTSAGSNGAATRTRSPPGTRSTSGWTPSRAGASQTRCSSSSACATSAAPSRASTTSSMARPATSSPTTISSRSCAAPTARSRDRGKRGRGHGCGGRGGQDRRWGATRSPAPFSTNRAASSRSSASSWSTCRSERVNYVAEVQQKVYDRMISERRRIAERSRSEGKGKRGGDPRPEGTRAEGDPVGGIPQSPGSHGQGRRRGHRRSTPRPTAATRSSTSS